MTEFDNLPGAVSEPESGSEGSLIVKKNRVADFIAKIVCLILAFFLWYYATAGESAVYQSEFTSVPVKIRNESGFSVLAGDDATVDLTVSGKRTVLNRLTKADLTAYVDISEIQSAGRYRFDVQYELPNGVTLDKASVSSITVYADNTTSVSVPVKVSVIGYMLDYDYELGLNAVTTDVKHVSVTGPESVVSDIAYASLQADIGHVTSSVRYSGDLVLIDQSGNVVTNSYVTCAVTTATATIPVYKYRDVPVTVTSRYGFFNGTNSEITAEPATVRIRGEAEAVDAVSISFEINERTVSESAITASAVYQYGLSLPSSVQNVEGVETVAVTVALRGMNVKTVPVYDVRITGLPDGLTYEPPTDLPLEVKVCGDTARIASINSLYLYAVADLSAQSVTGTVEVPVTIHFNNPYAGVVYELGEYAVPMQISQKPAE